MWYMCTGMEIMGSVPKCIERVTIDPEIYSCKYRCRYDTRSWFVLSTFVANMDPDANTEYLPQRT